MRAPSRGSRAALLCEQAFSGLSLSDVEAAPCKAMFRPKKAASQGYFFLYVDLSDPEATEDKPRRSKAGPSAFPPWACMQNGIWVSKCSVGDTGLALPVKS